MTRGGAAALCAALALAAGACAPADPAAGAPPASRAAMLDAAGMHDAAMDAYVGELWRDPYYVASKIYDRFTFGGHAHRAELAYLGGARAADPDNHFLMAAAGLAHHRISRYEGDPGRLEEAARWYGMALGAEPRSALALLGGASALAELGRHGGELAALDGALAVLGDVPALHANRAAALHHLGRHSEEAAALDAVLAAHPDDPGTLANRAAALHRAGDHAGALGAIDAAGRVLERYPDGGLRMMSTYGLAPLGSVLETYPRPQAGPGGAGPAVEEYLGDVLYVYPRYEYARHLLERLIWGSNGYLG